ncbi:MAG: peptide-methionine (S)-S-oxide reductase MsrA [Xanthomonadales bacterium]|nr:peptide-methionine (S)-S-oxide reductase MsrA [Xanthomonadales bacterium]
MPMLCELPGGSLRIAPSQFPDPERDVALDSASTEREAVLAGGCFWCTEAVYRQIDGVLDVTSGYAGGHAETANYKRVCQGDTGHAEVIRVRYDGARLSYGQLLKFFFSIAHNPTQLNRQGEDRGSQYRSAVFYGDQQQCDIAEAYIAQLHAADVFDAPIVTALEPLKAFYPAEDYHQDYARINPDQPYIRAAAAPKVEKLKRYFGDRLKGSDS